MTFLTQHRIDRRTLLRGIGGVTVALPALAVMAPRPAHAAKPRRFFLMYGGSSLGGDGIAGNEVIPNTVGADYELTRGLAPIGTLNVKKDVGVVSGLKIPWAAAGADAPPGARPLGSFHGSTVGAQMTGARLAKAEGNPAVPSADQIAADTLGIGAAQRSLAFRVQPVSYSGGNGGNRGRITFGKGGAIIDPIVSPRLAWQSLFSALPAATPGKTPTPEVDLALLRRRSVLDIVRGDTERLLVKLGSADRARLDRHFTELRELELRVGGTVRPGMTEATRGCVAPPQPMTDPPIGSNHKAEGDSLKFVVGAGYSSEDLRAQLLLDMVAMAFVCDVARVASVMLTMSQCFMSMEPIGGQKSDMHQLGHGAGNARDVADGIALHVKHFARLVAKLRDAQDADGSSVLDSTAMTLLFEGGHGYDPDGGRAVSSHSTEKMIAVVAGRAGGWKPGRHIVATDRHPAEVLVSAFRAVGVTAPLGEINTALPGLL